MITVTHVDRFLSFQNQILFTLFSSNIFEIIKIWNKKTVCYFLKYMVINRNEKWMQLDLAWCCQFVDRETVYFQLLVWMMQTVILIQ